MLTLEGKPLVRGFVAVDANLSDSEMGPVPGETGFFHQGADSFDLYQRVLLECRP